MKSQIICVPGGVAPAARRYAPLIASVGEAADLYLKDLELYRDAAPPSDYAIELELASIDQLADSLRLDRFHLVGYSGGGFVSLAYSGTRPERLLSLGLFEPAMIPGRLTAREQNEVGALTHKLEGLTGPEFMSTFVREQVKPGVHIPEQTGPFPPEMQNRPAGLAVLMRAFSRYEFNRESLRAGRFPVYTGYGGQTHELEEVKAGILAQLFSDIRVQRFEGVHHFVPPEEIYTPAHAESLRELWRRAEARSTPQLSFQK
jgi:pimeloyl-ACP methyl ester carboxylesterase